MRRIEQRFNESDPITLVALAVMLALLGAALFKALVTGYIFWTIIALWILLLVAAPEFVNGILARPGSRAGAVVMSMLIVIYLFLGPARPSVTDLNSLLWAIPGNMTLFSVCLITLLVVNERGKGHMVRQFLMVVTLISYMTLLLFQGPIDHYLGMLVGKTLVQGNAEFMLYIIISSAVGLALSYIVGWHMRRGSGSMINPQGVDWGD